MTLRIELEHEDDGRCIADVPALPGVVAYGASRDDAIRAVQVLALRVLAERLEHEPARGSLVDVSFVPA